MNLDGRQIEEGLVKTLKGLSDVLKQGRPFQTAPSMPAQPPLEWSKSIIVTTDWTTRPLPEEAKRLIDQRLVEAIVKEIKLESSPQQLLWSKLTLILARVDAMDDQGGLEPYMDRLRAMKAQVEDFMNNYVTRTMKKKRQVEAALKTVYLQTEKSLRSLQPYLQQEYGAPDMLLSIFSVGLQRASLFPKGRLLMEHAFQNDDADARSKLVQWCVMVDKGLKPDATVQTRSRLAKQRNLLFN